MSTAALIGKAVYTGTNGSNGNVTVGIATYPSDAISSAIGTTNLLNPGGSSLVGVPVYTGTNGSNGNVATRIAATGSIGTQGPVASPIFGPTYNPGS